MQEKTNERTQKREQITNRKESYIVKGVVNEHCLKKVSIDNLQRGAVVDMFDEEMKKVLENIGDENKRADFTRVITIKISIKPDKERYMAETSIDVTSKLAPTKKSSSLLFFSRSANGDVQASEKYLLQTPELPGISSNDDEGNTP